MKADHWAATHTKRIEPTSADVPLHPLHRSEGCRTSSSIRSHASACMSKDYSREDVKARFVGGGAKKSGREGHFFCYSTLPSAARDRRTWAHGIGRRPPAGRAAMQQAADRQRQARRRRCVQGLQLKNSLALSNQPLSVGLCLFPPFLSDSSSSLISLR